MKRNFNFGFAFVVIVALMIFNDNVLVLMSNIQKMFTKTFICQYQDQQNYGKAYPVYHGPDHRYTGRLDGAGLVLFKPRFEKVGYVDMSRW